MIEEQEEADEREDRHRRREQPVDLVVDAEHRDGAVDRRQDAARRRAVGDAHAFLQDQRQAEGRDDRERRDVVDGLDDDALDQRSQGEADQRREDERQPEIAGRLQRRPGQHGADHEEVAVREIDDVEQAEDDGEAERDQRDDQAPDQAVHGEQKKLVHLDSLPPSSALSAGIKRRRYRSVESMRRRCAGGCRTAPRGAIDEHGSPVCLHALHNTSCDDLARIEFDHVPVDAQFLGRQPERKADQLRQVQDRHVELLAHVLLDLVLEAVEHGVAERAGRHHRLRAVRLGRLDVLAR